MARSPNAGTSFLLGRFALAAGVSARTIDVRRLFHSLALGAAVFARRCHARTNGVCTLLGFRGRHFFLLASDRQR